MSFFKADTAAPFFRFVMELTSWIWMLILNIPLAVVSILSLALLNYPGDKRPVEEGTLGLAVPGKVRVILELATAILGILTGLALSYLVGGMQVLIVIAYIYTDSPRISWMWSGATYPPAYVTQLHKEREKHKQNKESKRKSS